jgi:hypothetical protein
MTGKSDMPFFIGIVVPDGSRPKKGSVGKSANGFLNFVDKLFCRDAGLLQNSPQRSGCKFCM